MDLKNLLPLLRQPLAPLLLLAACAFAMATALIAQYVFSAAPCPLCVWQRYAFLGIALCALLALLLRRHKPWDGWWLVLAGLCALAGAGIAFYHMGVENLWWAGLSSCSLNPAQGVEDAAGRVAALLATPMASCDVVSWSFLGLSMATWNIPFSLALFAFSLLAANETQNPDAEKTPAPE